MTDYRVNLDIFAGPLDLLLYLVRKDEVDIYDISIAKITEQYIHYIEMIKQLDIELAGDFLVMAATLMQLKSAMLLPKADLENVEEDLSDPRSELIRQLLEYKTFKDTAGVLSAAAAEQIQRFPRPSVIIDRLKPDAPPEIDIEQVNVWDLLEAFDAICRATGATLDLTHIEDDTPIDLYQIEILHRLQTEGNLNFEQIFIGRGNRLVMVGLFLALLELVREKLATIENMQSSKQLYVRPLTDVPAEKAVQDAMLASQEEEEKSESQIPQAEKSQEAEQEIEQEQTEPLRKTPPIAIVEIPAKKTGTKTQTQKSQLSEL